MSFIEVKDLSYSYEVDGKEKKALEKVDLEIEKGEFVAILGKNGSGKSTLAKLLSLIIESESGSIVIDGKEIKSDMNEEEIVGIRKKIGMVFQNPDDEIVATVVEEDVAFGPENLGIEPSEIRKRVNDSLDAVGMREYSRHAPHRLSGGQKQRIAIAGILAMMPECIIFDEATAMLDPSGRKDIMSLVSDIRSKGITVIFITHNMDEAALADRIIIMNKGKIVMEGKPREIFSKTDELNSFGLEAPQSTMLANELSKHGIEIDTCVLNEEECAEKILSLLRKQE